MSKSIDIARKTIDNKIAKGESFSWDGIQNEIVDNGGILRVGIGHTVGEYLTDLEERGIIAFNQYTKKYIVLEGH